MKAFLKTIKNILTLLTLAEKMSLLTISLSMVAVSILEILGIASVLPFIAVATNPNLIQNNTILISIFNYFKFSNQNEFLLLLGASSLVLIIFSNSLKAFSAWLLFQFAYDKNHTISTRLYEKYLYQPYEFFISRNSADLSRHILAEVTQVVNEAMLPLGKALARLFSAVLIVLLLILIDPLLAIVATMTFALAYLFIFKTLRKRLAKAGKERVLNNRERFKKVTETWGGIKDIKLMNKEYVFLKDFERPSKIFSKSLTTYATINLFPLYIIETVAFGGIIAIVLYFIITEERGPALALASLYAYAGYRLLPALQEIYTSISKVRYNSATIEALHKEFCAINDHLTKPDLKTSTTPVIKLKHCIKLENISYTYQSAPKPSLDKISLVVRANTTIGITGVTGGGKTTLVDIILGLLTPQTGQLLVDGIPIDHTNLLAWQTNIGYVPQFIYLCDDTIAANIAFGVPPELYDFDRIKLAAQVAQIDIQIETHMPQKYQTIIGERGIRLSGGERQRIGIARALYRDPSLLVLDEATSALDDATEKEAIKAIHSIAKNRTTIIIAHRMSTLENCDEIFQLSSNGNMITKA